MARLVSFKRRGMRQGSGQSLTFGGMALFEAGIIASICCGDVWSAEAGHVVAAERSQPIHVVTNAAQFRSVPREAFLGVCAFQLSGIVTLVDSHRDLLVVQDETGAVALHPRKVQDLGVHLGQRVLLAGSRCVPSAVGVPDFPYRPNGWGVRPSLEAPANWGSYYLSRLRGYLRPPATGEYTFWIASDNSSELWLSGDNDP